MSEFNFLFFSFVGFCLVLVLALVFLYNRLVSLRNLADEGWSDIDVVLKQRYDLIPNLVNTVKGAAEFEQETLEKVISLRSQAASTGNIHQKADSEDQLTQGLRQIFALSENYPQLKTNQSYLKLQEQLQTLEDTIAKARRYYNGTVRNYNTSIQSFPNTLFAGIFGFKLMEFFETADNVDQTPEVNL